MSYEEEQRQLSEEYKQLKMKCEFFQNISKIILKKRLILYLMDLIFNETDLSK